MKAKRIMALLMALALTVVLPACGDSKPAWESIEGEAGTEEPEAVGAEESKEEETEGAEAETEGLDVVKAEEAERVGEDGAETAEVGTGAETQVAEAAESEGKSETSGGSDSGSTSNSDSSDRGSASDSGISDRGSASGKESANHGSTSDNSSAGNGGTSADSEPASAQTSSESTPETAQAASAQAETVSESAPEPVQTASAQTDPTDLESAANSDGLYFCECGFETTDSDALYQHVMIHMFDNALNGMFAQNASESASEPVSESAAENTPRFTPESTLDTSVPATAHTHEWKDKYETRKVRTDDLIRCANCGFETYDESVMEEHLFDSLESGGNCGNYLYVPQYGYEDVLVGSYCDCGATQ